MTRTIIAVVSPADGHDAELNVQLFSDDNRIYAPVFRVGFPRNETQRQTMLTAIQRACTESFHVGACHGQRQAYKSAQGSLTIFEYDFDSIVLDDPTTALKYARI